MNLTTEDRNELGALMQSNDATGKPSPLMRLHWNESGYRRFVRAGLVNWGSPPDGFSSRFAGATITAAGRATLNTP